MFLNKGKNGKQQGMDLKNLLLTSEELVHHAGEIAKNHTVFSDSFSLRQLLKRIDQNFKIITLVYANFHDAINHKGHLCPASEWLLDNFYKVEEQAKEVRQNLLKEKFLRLNTLNTGVLRGYPRIYGVVLEFVAHTDGNLDEDLLISYVKAYQCQRVLTTAEIWALSLMIRSALIENIRRICEKIYYSYWEREKAEKAAELPEEEILLAIKANVELDGRANSAYVEHLLKVLKRDEIEAEVVLNYLQKKLRDYNTTIRDLVEEEHQTQAKAKISIGNSITSLNKVASLDWNDIFESLSIVEEILNKDPGHIYPQLDFDSRDYYRNHVEKIGRKLREAETRVARKAIEQSQLAKDKNEDERKCHVGYYLVDKGRKELFESLNHPDKRDFLQEQPLAIYFIPIALFTIPIFCLSLSYGVSFHNETSGIILLLISLLVLISASDLAVSLTNSLLTNLFPPSFLPRIEYKNGIPEEVSSLVVVPVLLPDGQRGREILGQLEVFYLANLEENLYFALAGDFKDANTKEMPEDNEIVNIVMEGVKNLNRKYGKEIFYYFHRERKLCQKQNKWLGWERKRGALVELNQLILGEESTSYSILSGDITKLKFVKYILTIDADTQLPMDTAKKLIGIASHPLNRPIIDEKKGVVIEGYGLIQPRIGVNIESANRSFFTRTFAGRGGVDSYTIANSDIYQDLFGRGIFTGKGIYDVELFNRLLKNAIPENRVLSHDLLEGSYLRTGLAEDFELIDDYPSKYSAYMLRLHRWVRGDWQLIRWLFPSRNNPLPILARWHILDNMRRSLVPISLLLLFIFALTVFPGQAIFWLGLGIIIMGFPLLINLLYYLKDRYYMRQNDRVKGDLVAEVKAAFYRVVLDFIFLPYEAYMMADAILRTLYRILISKDNLLEWTTAADVERNLTDDFKSFAIRMQSSFIITAILLISTFTLKPYNFLYTIPIAFLWGMGPFVAFNISKETKRGDHKLQNYELELLRKIGRKTWAYYEDFVGEESNNLPPDNYQLIPKDLLAQRTSPTNIGIYIISVLSARDFGYLSTSEMVKKIEKTITSIGKMEKWKGHLFNWYDTLTLEILRPYYISTVDSGNFISYIITAREGLREYLKRPLIGREILMGLRDTLILLEDNDGIIRDDLYDLLCREKPLMNQLMDISQHIKNKQRDADAYCGWERRFYDMADIICREVESFFITKPIMDKYELDLEDKSLSELKMLYKEILSKARQESNEDLEKELLQKISNIDGLTDKINKLIKSMDDIVEATEFTHLYDQKRHLFSIGYNMDEERLTNSYYDLLASEARVASYIAIARREAPQKHWFKLGRTMTLIDGSRSLVSWTGTMFEYFMPYLIMKNYDNGLMDETYSTTIKAQKTYCQNKNIPWGISESGYYSFDMALSYQYKAFGIPDLGLKRGLSKDLVISAYSTFLALPFRPRDAMDNILRLIETGAEGQYGLYEAIDYMPRTMVSKEKFEIVKSFMAHHQGMIFVSLNNFFNKNIMQKRFHKDPVIRAGETLLQERIPTRIIITKQYKEGIYSSRKEKEKFEIEKLVRTYGGWEGPLAQCHLLSNGNYSLMLTNWGTGYSKIRDIQISRWRQDAITGKDGIYIFINHLNKNKIWSTGAAPSYQQADNYKVSFSQDKAEFFRRDEDIDTHTEIVVSPEDNVEIRKVRLTNHGEEVANIEVTSYFEIVLTHQNADLAHPAFSNLFVRTEVLPEENALIASRRSRENGKEAKWIFHRVAVEGETMGGLQYESNREAFIGRGRDISNAVALTKPLGGSVGIVLDPIMSLKKTMKISPGQSIIVYFTIGIEKTKEKVISLVKKYGDSSAIDRAFQLAITRSQVEMNYLDIKPSELKLYQNMIGQIIYLNPLRRKYEDILKANNKSQSGLWAYGISGDLPIVLISIKSTEDIGVVKQFIKAHEYWRLRGLSVDLLILNEDASNYFQPLHHLIQDVVSSGQGKHIMDQPGGFFIKNVSNMPLEDKNLLYTVARLVIRAGEGFLSKQIEMKEEDLFEDKIFDKAGKQYSIKEDVLELEYDNGYGGFSKDGKEYIIQLKDDISTPAPWINVVANKEFGFIISERGSSFTWAENSRENRLTPWSNDYVGDPSGEIIYIRDEDTGETWSPTGQPIRSKATYTIGHGLGYSRFLHKGNGIDQELTVYVAKEDSIKINLLKLKNPGKEKRNLSLIYFIRPVMGISDEITQQYIVTDLDKQGRGILIRNPYNADFKGRIGFVSTSEKIHSFTCDRREFVGIQGNMEKPAGLKREKFSNSFGAGYDPCVALQVNLEIQGQEEKELVFLLGQGQNFDQVDKMISYYREMDNCTNALNEIRDYWLGLVATIQVETPDLSMNLMLNQWLIYQSICCRIWARSAFYQSGGAYGYRDQLQDAMNMVYPSPEITREQILLNCAHQFVEGDVQHWWHPGAGDKGIRTRFSDDLLWLPYAVVEYLEITEDYSILEEEVGFLEEEPLREDEDERYGIPRISQEKASVYEHCLRSIERGLKFGQHGIPLMGSGDWNDGMNTVGNKGKGESVWLGWFMYSILMDFAKLCRKMGEEDRANRYVNHARGIGQAIEKNAWDGGWYIRAFFDDGSPLGSASNTECKIDSLAQSWSIISQGGNKERSIKAMQAVEEYLIKKNEGLILLFTPPFDKGDQNPGYIKGYVPGVRENGGQYTHAATWVIKAFSMLGDGDKAWELFNLINPINHSRTPLECATYKLEPYVMAADVYAVNPHIGRGGWSWYTGVSGWMYRVGIKDILGLKKKGDKLIIDPCIPKDWKEYKVSYRYLSTLYNITVKNPDGVNNMVKKIILDDKPILGKYIPLIDDKKDHKVEVIM